MEKKILIVIDEAAGIIGGSYKSPLKHA